MAVDDQTALSSKNGLASAWLIGLGHGATHWIAGIFYFCIPFLSDELGISYVQAGAFAAIFQVASFSANIGSGPVVDMTGRRVLWQVISLLAGALALFAFSQGSSFLIAGAAVALIGASNNLWHPAAISYLSLRYPQRRGFALSIHALGANMGDAVAPLLMGLLIALMGWRGASGLSVILPVLVAVALLLFLRRTGQSGAGSSDAGVTTFSSYLSGLKSLVTNKAVLAMCVMSGFRNLAQVGLMVFLPLYLADELQLSPWLMGVVLFAFQFGGIVAAPLAGHLSDRIGRRPVVMAGLSGSTVVIVLLTFTGNAVVYVAGVSLLGFALFAIRPVVHSWLMDITPDSMGGSATSLMFGIQSMLSVISPIAGGWLADHYGLQAAFYFLGAGMLAANLIALTLPRKEPV